MGLIDLDLVGLSMDLIDWYVTGLIDLDLVELLVGLIDWDEVCLPMGLIGWHVVGFLMGLIDWDEVVLLGQCGWRGWCVRRGVGHRAG